MSDLPKHNNYLIIICGPTASGKSTCAIELATHYQTEILSTDSRQIYQELNIGTAKPSHNELQMCTHHFINKISIQDEYSAGQYERNALALLDELFKSKRLAIAAGGTGLYVNALVDGFDDIPNTGEGIREEIIKEYETLGLAHLQQEAESADPVSYAKTDIQNPQRLMRLIEVFRTTGQPRSSFFLPKAERNFKTIKIGLEVDREALYAAINQRVDQMMEDGLVKEVEQFLEFKHLNALKTVGYAELIDHLEGRITLEKAVELIKRNSRRYAKRQMTWFRKDQDIQWFSPQDTDSMIAYIDRCMHNLEQA